MVMPLSTTRPSTWWNTGDVGGVEFVGAIDPAGAHDRDRRRARQHRPRLHRRRVGAQHQTALGIRLTGGGVAPGSMR